MWRLLAEVQGANAVLLAGVALACAVLLFRTQRRIRQQHRGPLAAPPAWTPASSTQPGAANRLDAPLELQRFEVQLHDMAREATARIDNKIGILEHLIRDADARIARLQMVDEWLDRSATPGPKLDAKLDGGSSIESDIVLSKLSAGGRGRGASTADRPLENQSQRPAKSAPASRAEIYALADAGHASAEIASRLGSPVGEVELILGLRRER